MKKRFYICLLIAMAVNGYAAYSNATLNITSCGGTISGGGYVNSGSVVPVGGQVAQSVSFCNWSGFAAGFILQPGTAFSGLPDELNPDNDRDGLLDDEEIIAGSNLYNRDTDGDALDDFAEVKTYGTSPILADSDADGMNDDRELVAGTSPTNRNSTLSVACTLLPNGQKKLSWFGVQGRAYTFQYSDSLKTDWQSNPFEIAGTGAVISFTDSGASSNRFYRVKVRAAE
ncbi:MAG: hypothetical protein WC701_06625 [Kiritimatiellales bacterium]|jgi:hypothetical protein